MNSELKQFLNDNLIKLMIFIGIIFFLIQMYITQVSITNLYYYKEYNKLYSKNIELENIKNR